MKVEKLMNPDVIYFFEDDDLFYAVKELLLHNISGAPVLNKNGKIVGIISMSDIIKLLNMRLDLEVKNFSSITDLLIEFFKKYKEVSDLKSMKEKLFGIKVRDIMSKNVIYLSKDSTVSEAVKLMEEKKISRIPIVDENERLIGIITKTDILRFLIEL